MKGTNRDCLNERKLNLNDNGSNNTSMFASNESLISVHSSTGGCSSRRSSEEYDSRGDILENPNFKVNNCERSKSCFGFYEDGSDREQVEIFPNLSDELLEEMGLTGEERRKLQNDEELEQKFATLSLAFTIDSATIKDRCERQRRYRDQTEKNLMVELERLTEKVNGLNKFCIDLETTELLATLLAQINIVTNASTLAASSAERYGAVQHEERLSDAVQLMINHVNSLKQQRDLSRKQLQYTKRMLQDTNSNGGNSPKDRKLLQQVQNSRMLTKKRSNSIAIASIQDSRRNADKLMKRSTELTFRTNAIPKLTKPSRMDLGVDLVKIKEGMVDENIYEYENSISDKESTGCDESEEENNKLSEERGCNGYLELLQRKAHVTYKKWCKDGNLSHFFYICAIVCFCLGVILMANILFELKLAKRLIVKVFKTYIIHLTAQHKQTT